MFSDNEANDLRQILEGVLAEQHAGRPDTRAGVAAALVVAARDYLKGRYNTAPKGEEGITKLRDVI